MIHTLHWNVYYFRIIPKSDDKIYEALVFKQLQIIILKVKLVLILFIYMQY